MLPKQEANNVALWGSDRRNGAGAAAATEKSELARRFALHSEPRAAVATARFTAATPR